MQQLFSEREGEIHIVTYIFLTCGENKVVKVSTAGRIMVKSSVVSWAAFLLFTKYAVCSKEQNEFPFP